MSSAPSRTTARFAIAALAILPSCGVAEDLAQEASCDRGQIFVILAQAVPSATLLPCIDVYPPGWSYGGSDVRNGRARYWLSSDRAGVHAVEVELSPSCDVSSALDVTVSSGERGVLVFLERLALHPFSANEYFVFPGGCVTYRLRFGAGVDESLAFSQAELALTFGPREVLVELIRHDLGLTLCGAGAPPCPG